MGQIGRWVRILGVSALGLLAFPGWALLRADQPPGTVLATLAAVTAFVAGYAWVLLGTDARRDVRRNTAVVTTLAGSAAVVNVISPEDLRWGVLFVYACAASGLVLPWRAGATAVIGVIALAAVTLVVVRSSLTPDVQSDLVVTGPQGLLELLLVGLGAVAVRRLVETTTELGAAQAQMEWLAVEKERLRFARDLHDLLGHSLSLIVLKAELAGRLTSERPHLVAREVRDIERVARDALGEVREAVTGYRAQTFASELVAARAMLEAAGIACRVIGASGASLGNLDTTFAWALREGTTNVARHSGATRCDIRLVETTHTSGLEISDNGGGGSGGWSNGLSGLAERASARGGSLEAGSLAGGGFRLWLSLPTQVAHTSTAAEADWRQS